MRCTHPVCWMTLPFLAVVAASVLTAVPAAQEQDNPYTSRLDTGMGRRLFQSQCTTCHGLNATGGDEGRPDRAPAATRVSWPETSAWVPAGTPLASRMKATTLV